MFIEDPIMVSLLDAIKVNQLDQDLVALENCVITANGDVKIGKRRLRLVD